MKAIKTKTYRNFMIIYNRLLKKGYDRSEAEAITHRIFDQYETCPMGLGINELESLVISKAEWMMQNSEGRRA